MYLTTIIAIVVILEVIGMSSNYCCGIYKVNNTMTIQRYICCVVDSTAISGVVTTSSYIVTK